MENKFCEECEQEERAAQGMGLRQRIWETQLSQHREIYLNGDINDSVIELVVAQIQNINKLDDEHAAAIINYEREPIKLFINSNGGEIDAAFSVISAVESSVTPVYTIALGKAMSAGFLILIAGHLRWAQKYSTLLYHQGSSGYIGKMQDIMEHADYLIRLQVKVQRYVIDATEISQEDLDENMARKFDWYLTPEDGINYGCIDGIWGVGLAQEVEDAPEYETEDDAVYAYECEECCSKDTPRDEYDDYDGKYDHDY